MCRTEEWIYYSCGLHVTVCDMNSYYTVHSDLAYVAGATFKIAHKPLALNLAAQLLDF